MGLLASFEKLLSPSLPQWAIDAGVTQNADGSVTMPDGMTGRVQRDPPGTILLSDGTVVGGAGGGQDQQKNAGSNTGDPWWRHWSTVVSGAEIVGGNLASHAKWTTIGTLAGLLVGAVAGTMVAGPIGAKVIGSATAGLGGYLGYKVS